MIANPNFRDALKDEIATATREALEDEDFLNKGGRIKVRKLTKYDDPKRFERHMTGVVREIETAAVNIDAKIMEGGRIHHYKSAQEFLRSKGVIRRLAEAKERGMVLPDEISLMKSGIEKKSLKHTLQIRELKEGSDFELGLYPDEQRTNGRVFPVSDVILPSLNSPHSKNALLVDYLDAHRKSWEAATFNPIAKRISKIIPQFVLGRGVKGSVDSLPHQKAWDTFYHDNRMRQRVKQSLRETVIFGEIFWRFFETRGGLQVRSVDPSTIWEIVTDEEDVEAVKYYHQQYMRLNQAPLLGGVPTPSTVVIRQIPAAEIDHYKINATSSEKRGRGELFPILGYLLRFKEFVDDRIAFNKMRAMFAMDIAVEGSQEDVDAADAQFSEPPGPAAVLVHNKAVEVEFKNANANAGDALTDAETILKVIAIGAGVSENFLGVARAQSRAGALISTEPDVKNFEDYQELVEEILMRTSERVFAAAGLGEKIMEFTFPAIAQEDRSAKLKDISFEESMDHISKRRAATMAAREFQISDYDYTKEQQDIEEERKGDPVITATLQQVQKIAPALPGGETPGMGADLVPVAARPSKKGVTQTSGQMGFAADGGGRGLADTKATLNRPGFTRGGEKTAILNNRTSGTPLRHSAGEAPKRNVWSAAAREKSAQVRAARAAERKRQQSQS